MKKTFLFSALAVLTLLCSCSKQIYSHEQVLRSYHIKAEVIRQFGQPDEIMASNDTIRWIYNCSTLSIFAASRTKVKINGTYNSAAGYSSVPASVTEFSKYDTCVKFTFNKEGNVLGWNTSGVNFAQRKAKTFATIALVVGSTTIFVGIVGSILFLTALANW